MCNFCSNIFTNATPNPVNPNYGVDTSGYVWTMPPECDCCGSVVTQSFTIQDILPTSFSNEPKFVFFHVENTVDMDITGWTPTGLCVGSIVRFQKAETNGTKIEYTDINNVQYSYINKKGEVLTLVYTESGTFEII